MQNISKTLAILGMLSPMGVNALGIGDIRLQSALNQSLRAEIPLVISGSESIEDIKVSIASSEAFAKAGVERHYQLSQLRFVPVKKPDGSYAIQVSSREAIREPFLNFLVEVNWPQGRLLREFTVLLDPPAAYKEETLGIPALPETTAAPISRMGLERRETGGERPARVSTRATSADTTRMQGSEYGPVQRNETLWGIARLINRDPSITHEQMVIALYEANPQAFYKDNLNALKAGEILKIPDRQTVLRISPREARAQLYGQATRTGKLTDRRPQTAVPETVAEGMEQQGKLKLLAPMEGGKAKSETAIPGTQAESAKAKSEIALEVADTVKQENEEIRARINQLEQQLATVQRLLMLKDEQIAKLQAQQGSPEQPTPPSTPPEVVPAPAVQAPTLAQPAVTTQTGTGVKAPQPAEQATAAPAPTPAVQAPSTAAEPPSEKSEPRATLEKSTAPQQPVSQAKEETGMFSALLGDPLLMGLGAAGLTLLGTYFWRGYKRRLALTRESESILIPPVRERYDEPGMAFAPVRDGTPSEQVAPAARSSFLSEFSTSDFDALGGEVDEVDPISEADVYLAYGRYKQAEELIRHAIEQYPDRDECKLKLLEIHYATENRQAFESYAKELFNLHKDSDPEFWDKVVEMGQELCPDSPLFSRQDYADLTGRNEESRLLTDDELNASLELDEDLLAELQNLEAQQIEPPVAEPSLSDQSASAALDPTHREKIAEDQFDSIDFEAPVIPKPSVKKAEEKVEFDNLIPFESLKSAEREDNKVVQIRPDKTLDDILVEMGAVSTPRGDHSSTVKQVKGQQQGEVKDEFDLDFSLIKPNGSGVKQGVQSAVEMEFESVDGLEGLDEFETKLDLAKAFVDMADEVSARQILQEVLAQGSDLQRKEAQVLLEKLAKEKAR